MYTVKIISTPYRSLVFYILKGSSSLWIKGVNLNKPPIVGREPSFEVVVLCCSLLKGHVLRCSWCFELIPKTLQFLAEAENSSWKGVTSIESVSLILCDTCMSMYVLRRQVVYWIKSAPSHVPFNCDWWLASTMSSDVISSICASRQKQWNSMCSWMRAEVTCAYLLLLFGRL